MDRVLPLCLGLLLSVAWGLLPVQAQEADTSQGSAWTRDLVSKLSASQAGFQNWTEGGVNSLAFSMGLNGKAERTDGRWSQIHQARFAFGLVKQDTLDFRKAEDVIRFASSLQYNGEGFFRHFNPTLAAELRTQFAAGFNFDVDPLKQGRELPVKVSAFFSPAVFNQSVGLTYDPVEWFTQRVGIAAKETIVLIERLRPLYAVDPAKTGRFELGIESRTELDREIVQNVHLNSVVALFASFNQQNVPDLLWENLIVMKVNSFLNVNFEFVTLFDKDISDDVQLKEVLSVGVSIVFL